MRTGHRARASRFNCLLSFVLLFSFNYAAVFLLMSRALALLTTSTEFHSDTHNHAVFLNPSSKGNERHNTKHKNGKCVVDRSHHLPPVGTDCRSETGSCPNKETFSACLLVMDENFRLREWLAYHYHVLPLRRVVVAVDPRSRTSPTPIFDFFRQELGMNITEWTDADFGYVRPPNNATSDVRGQHLHRQRRFLGKCIEHLHLQGHTWTACYDTDECSTIDTQTPIKQHDFFKVTNRTSLNPPGSILQYILQGKQQGLLTDDNCIIVPRVLFGALHDETDTQPSVLPDGLALEDPGRLETLRFRQHEKLGNQKMNGLGKPFIDVSKVGPLLPLTVHSPHRVSPWSMVAGP